VPDLILLQWSGSNGTEAAIGNFKAGQDTRTSRIVVIAAEDHISAAIVALEFGADDCLAAPFTSEELIGRVNACLRRPPTVSRRDRVRGGPLLLDRVAHSLFVSDDCVPLAPTELGAKAHVPARNLSLDCELGQGAVTMATDRR